ncbi:hypothetical protein O0882_12600 [Janthinobacterium sp. SUN073]|uniref:hypothetical protein n=1 Tax=Janthinobacterium sp. SUN073 TaxID=3004102 RepID=UPI0025B120AF|nr:hypothetical protein [Janthinobacterium sp. SUN073]MDN2697157.1 hypothetical protein [Janthinobacterium sp. SUN073]
MAISIHQLQRGLKVRLDTTRETPIMSVIDFGEKMGDFYKKRLMVHCEWHEKYQGMVQGEFPAESLVIVRQ